MFEKLLLSKIEKSMINFGIHIQRSPGYFPEETFCKLVMLKNFVRMRFFSTCTHTCKIEYSLQEIKKPAASNGTKKEILRKNLDKNKKKF